MIVLGLTGSIGMGKSATAALFRRAGIRVFDADQTVHRLSAPGGKALPDIARLFPAAVTQGKLDRAALGARVFADPDARRTLEALLHPLVAAERQAFLRRARAERRALVLLDVPLLFETGGDKNCDRVLVVSCPAFLQRQRALRRPGMTQEKFDFIHATQMPDRVKRRLADFVWQTGAGRRPVWAALRRFLRDLRSGLPKRRRSRICSSFPRTAQG